MRIRVRDHVNPFSPRLTALPAPLDFAAIFKHPHLPLHLDLGCALGQFVFKMAQINMNRNFLGLEIREPMIERARRLTENAKLGNLHYEFCNATISIENLLKKIPAGVLQNVTIQFPDPHLKKRLNKRRMVQPRLVADLAKYAAESARIFIQSDVEEAALDICEKFAQNGNFQRIHYAYWVDENPFPIKTEREIVVESKGLKVFRAIFERKSVK